MGFGIMQSMSRAEFNPGAGMLSEAESRIDALRKQKSKQIVDGILKHGILSGRDLVRLRKKAFMSSDEWQNTEIYGRLVVPLGPKYVKDHLNEEVIISTSITDENLQIKEDLPSMHTSEIGEYLLKDAVYGLNGRRTDDLHPEQFAILPVLIEREGECIVPSIELRGDRVKHSILIATPVKEIDEQVVLQTEGNVSVPGPIPICSYSRIFLPQEIVGELQADIQSAGVQVNAVEDTKGIIWRKNMIVPDYEGAIRKLLKKQDPLFLHGVRLPTNEDVEMGRV